MGLRVKPSSAAKKSFTKGDSEKSKAASSVGPRAASGQMTKATNKGAYSKSNSRPRTLDALKKRTGGTKAGGR